jgi:hypothetical protein
MLPKIKTEHVYPPIPLRSFDYSAAFDGYEPGDPIGWGATEEAAIADLKSQTCSHCGRADTYTGPCGVGGCPLGADL